MNSINIDFDGDGNKAYILAVNLGDSLFDAIKIKTGDFNTDWDGDWIAKTKNGDCRRRSCAKRERSFTISEFSSRKGKYTHRS